MVDQHGGVGGGEVPPLPPSEAPPPFGPPSERQDEPQHPGDATQGGEHSQSADERHGSTRRSEHLHTVIAISIALISVIGAVIGWRVEVHSSSASDLDQNAVQASIAFTGLQSDAQQQAYHAAASYNQFLRVQDDAQQLTGQPCSGNWDATTVVGADALVECILNTPLSQYFLPAYIPRSNFRKYDVNRFAADIEAINRYTKNINPNIYQSQADDERHAEYRMLWLSVLLVAALVLCTLAQLERRRVRATQLAVPGWVLLAASIGLLVGWGG